MKAVTPPAIARQGREKPILTCHYLTPWHLCHPCAHCLADVDQACRDMAMDRLLGIYDARGFTPAERIRADQQAKGRR